MNYDMINPFVRYARKNEKLFYDTEYKAFDHRIFYLQEGSAVIFLNDNRHTLKKGDVVYWHSGIKYSVLVNSDTVISGCNFDFITNENTPISPIPPLTAEEFSNNCIEDFSFDDAELFNSYFIINGAFDLADSFRELAREFENKRIFYSNRCSAILKDVLFTCMRLSQFDNNSKSSKKAKEIIDYVKEHYNENITNATIAEYFHYHPNYVSNIISKTTGKSLHKYVITYRIYKAINILQSTDVSISEVAEMVGIPDIQHFSKTFKNIVGTSPRAFKAR